MLISVFLMVSLPCWFCFSKGMLVFFKLFRRRDRRKANLLNLKSFWKFIFLISCIMADRTSGVHIGHLKYTFRVHIEHFVNSCNLFGKLHHTAYLSITTSQNNSITTDLAGTHETNCYSGNCLAYHLIPKPSTCPWHMFPVFWNKYLFCRHKRRMVEDNAARQYWLNWLC